MKILSKRQDQTKILTRPIVKQAFTKIAIMLVGMFAVLTSKAQTTTIYYQNFGTSVVASSSLASTLTGTGTGGSGTTWSLVSGEQSGNLSIGTSVSSTTYTGASGGGAFEDGAGTPAVGTGEAIITGLSTSGYSGIGISFGAYKSSTSESSTLKIYYSTDGGTTWSSSPIITLVAASGLSNTTFTNLETYGSFSGSPLDNQSNLALKLSFTRTATSGSMRIDDLTITGTSTSSPSLTPSPTSLSGFSYNVGNGPSTSQSFNLSGSSLSSNATITISGSTDYEVSTDNSSFGSSKTLTASGTSLASTPVYVRLKSGLSYGTYNENITYSGGGVSSTNFAVSGNVNISDFYSASTGDLGTLTNWSSNTNGTGGTNPSTFGTAGINFHIANSNPGTLTVTAGGSTTFTSNITGTGPLTFLGTSTSSNATLTLGGTNTFTGGLTVGGAATTNIGTLSLPSTATSSTLPSTGTIIINTGSCLLNASSGLTFSNNMILNGQGNSTNAGAIRSSANLTLSGNITLGSNTFLYPTGTNTNTLTLSGNISDGNNGYYIQKQAGGNLTFSGTGNTWTGGLILANGAVTVNSGSSLGSGPIIMAGGSNSVTLTLNNSTETTDSLASVAGTSTQIIALGSSTSLVVNQAGNSTFGDASGTQLVDITGTSGSTVEKQGAGTLTLTTGATSGASNNTFGTLKVTGGTIVINPYNSVTSSSTTVILNGGTLSTSGITASRSATFSTLNVTAASTINLESTNAHTLSFAATSGTWTSALTITGWQGTPNGASSGTVGKIFVGTTATGLNATDLAMITFSISGTNYSAAQLSTGEIVPSGAVITNYYSNSSGALDNLSTWSTNTNGSGGSNPSSFTNNYQIFHIANGNSGTITGSSWTVSGSSSSVDVDQSTDLTISSKAINATINVGSGRTLTISNSTLPTFDSLNASSTVDFLNISGGITTLPTATFGNVIFDNTSYTPSSAQTLNLAGNLTVQNSGSINSASSSAYVTVNIAGTGNQTITGNNNTIKLYQLKNNTNTTGTLTLAANTPITTLDNLILVQNGSSNQFSDGGNTLTVGNNLYLDGNTAGYNLTGTIILNAASGTAAIANNSSSLGAIVPVLNNLNLNTTSAVKFYPTAGGGTVNIAGNLSVGSTVTSLVFYTNTIKLGGNFSYQPSTDIVGTTAANLGTLNFDGTGAQSYTSNYTTSTGTNWGGWTVSNTSGTVTLSAPVKVTLITTINSGATLALSGATTILSSAGSGSGLVNNGTISGTGEIKMSGSNATPTMSGTGSISNLEMAKTANMTLNSGAIQTITSHMRMTTAGTLTLSGTMNIASTAAVDSVTTGATLACGTGGLVLESDNSGSAYIGPVNGTVSGTVQVQRYLQSQRGYRLLGHPFTASSEPTINTLGNYFDITGITGGNIGPSSSHCQSTTPSTYTYNPGSSPSYTGITSTSTAIPAAQSSSSFANGILAFVRGGTGDVGCNTTGSYTVTPVTMTLTGAVNTGDITEKVPANGWNLISNPYPAPVLLSAVDNIGNLNGIVVIQPAQQNGGHNYTNGTAYFTADNSYILPINGAFLANNATGSDISLVFHETSKTTSTPSSGLLKTTNAYPALALSVYNNGDFWDNWKLTLKPGASNNSGDAGDLIKIANTQLTFYSLSANNVDMAWDARDADSIADGAVIPMGITSIQTSYTLEVADYSLPTDKTVYLHDKYTGSYVLLGNGVSYPFTVNTDTASQGKNRMELIFNENSSNTGIGTVANRTAGVMIVPNPATNNVTVSYNNTYSGAKTISIVNIVGQVVKELNTTEQSVNIPVDYLTNGMYLIRTTVNGKTVTERFIKN